MYGWTDHFFHGKMNLLSLSCGGTGGILSYKLTLPSPVHIHIIGNTDFKLKEREEKYASRSIRAMIHLQFNMVTGKRAKTISFPFFLFHSPIGVKQTSAIPSQQKARSFVSMSRSLCYTTCLGTTAQTGYCRVVQRLLFPTRRPLML